MTKTDTQADLREQLADLEHQQWAHWTAYMLDNLTERNIERWKRQVATPYSELSDAEKDSDRKWADKVASLVQLDAAVAAVVEKAAQTLEEKAKSTRERWNRAPTLSARITYRHHAEGIEASVNIVRALAPTDALAERDAKVRADALREAVEIAIDERNKRGADKSTNGLWTAITRIQALIDGEA